MSLATDSNSDASAPQNKPESITIAIAEITRDPELQCRANGIVVALVKQYAQAMREHGAERFAEIVIFTDSKGVNHLADGFTRCAAAELAGVTELRAYRYRGTRRDALLFAAGANAEHGRQRTPADKKAAVRKLLSDPTWAKRADNWLGKHAKVSHTFVKKVRSTCHDSSDGVRETSDGRVMDTSKIGRNADETIVEKLTASIEKLIEQWPDTEHTALRTLLVTWSDALTPTPAAAE